MKKLNASILQILGVVFVVSLVTGQAFALDNTYKSLAENETNHDSVIKNWAEVPDEHLESRSSQDKLRMGERMYREGILPSGKPVQISVMGDVRTESTVFTCVSCHLRGGLGSIEGGVTTPPATGAILFQPFYNGTILTSSARSPRNHYTINPSRRTAYTPETLVKALRDGMNPDGRKLNDVMPRYNLQDEDMALLIQYLVSLSATVSPGVDNTTLRLATIITDDVPPESRRAMLEQLENFVAFKNSQAKVYATRTKYMAGGGFPEELNLAYRKLSLARWELKGRPETWSDQLDEFYRKEPVFAFIGGISAGEWKPIHDFSEAHKIPSLFPFTDFPVISDTDWYTIYFSKGLYQEGEAAAGFLGGVNGITPGSSILQIVQSSRESRALSAGFVEMWSELGNNPPLTVSLKDNEPVSRELLRQLVATHKPSAILLWTGSEVLPVLESISQDRNTPKYLFVSSGYLKNDIWSVPENARGITYITYPFRLPQDPFRPPNVTAPNSGNSPSPVKNNAERNDGQRIPTRVQAITEVLQLGLMDMNRNFYRDTFLDVISMIPDQKPQDYESLSFGPGQRYASRGCNIVQLSVGAKPELVKKSAWAIH
jgi:hypothetical protein